MPWAALIPWTTAALGRRSVLSWKFGDLREMAGFGKNPWRVRTGVSAFDPPSDDGASDRNGLAVGDDHEGQWDPGKIGRSDAPGRMPGP